MNGTNFTKEDHQKFVDFLNFVAKNAKFSDMSTKEMIEFVKLLGAVQNLVPKIEANILEVMRVVKASESVPAIPKE